MLRTYQTKLATKMNAPRLSFLPKITDDSLSSPAAECFNGSDDARPDILRDVLASDLHDWESTRQATRTSRRFDLFMSEKTHATITHSVPYLTANISKTENANRDVVVRPAVFAQCFCYFTNSDGDVSDENVKLRLQVSQLKSDLLIVSIENDVLQLEKSSLKFL